MPRRPVRQGRRRRDAGDRPHGAARRPRRRAHADARRRSRAAPTRSNLASGRPHHGRDAARAPRSRSTSTPGRRTTTCCCPAPATPAIASSRARRRVSAAADRAGRHRSPRSRRSFPTSPASAPATGRRRSPSTRPIWRRPRSRVHVPAARLGIIVLAPATAAGGGVDSGRESDDRTAAIVTGLGTARRATLASRIANAACAPAAPGSRVHAYGSRLRLRRRPRAVRTAVRAAQGADRPDRAGSRAAVLGGVRRARGARERPLGRKARHSRGRRSRDSAYSTWQTGWCGGLAATLPLIAAGSKPSRERALATDRVRARRRPGAVGLLPRRSPTARPGPTTGSRRRCRRPAPPRAAAAAPVYKQARRWHLVRRSADALTFLVKQLALLERQPELRGRAPGPSLGEGGRRAADALVKLWERYKQLGQFVDIESGELVVGGSTSAGLAPAGLALAATQLKEPRYLAGREGDRRALLRALRARRA